MFEVWTEGGGGDRERLGPCSPTSVLMDMLLLVGVICPGGDMAGDGAVLEATSARPPDAPRVGGVVDLAVVDQRGRVECSRKSAPYPPRLKQTLGTAYAAYQRCARREEVGGEGGLEPKSLCPKKWPKSIFPLWKMQVIYKKIATSCLSFCCQRV